MMPRLHTLIHAGLILLTVAAMLIVSWPAWAKLLYTAIIGIIAARMERSEADLRKAEAELKEALAKQAQRERFSAEIAAAEAEVRRRMFQW